MRRSRSALSGVVCLSACFLASCQAPSPPPASRPAETETAPLTSSGSDTQKRTAEEYARKLEEILARRRALATQPASAPTVQPSTAPSSYEALNNARLPASRPLPTATPPTPPPSPTEAVSPAPVISEPPNAPPASAPVVQIHPPTRPVGPLPSAALQPATAIDPLADRIRKAAHDAPRDVAANLDLQLWQLISGLPSPDLAALSSLPAEDREVLSTLLDGLSNYRASVRDDPNAMLSKKVRPLLDMADRLSTQADLRIPTALLCTRVTAYGNYEPLTAPMVAGRENRALVYTEIAGFASTPAANQLWETRLTEEIVLYRNEVEAWKKPRPDPIVDQCRNRRRDFYAINLISLPPTLPAGPYTLKITLIDQIANHVAETTLPITLLPAASTP